MNGTCCGLCNNPFVPSGVFVKWFSFLSAIDVPDSLRHWVHFGAAKLAAVPQSIDADKLFAHWRLALGDASVKLSLYSIKLLCTMLHSLASCKCM